MAIVISSNINDGLAHPGTVQAATDSMSDMPPRHEEELDPVTLHNQALLDMESETLATAGFEKLQFLLESPSSPPGWYFPLEHPNPKLLLRICFLCVCVGCFSYLPLN